MTSDEPATADEHPLHRLERAALEYARAAARCAGANRRATQYTGRRAERADQLAAEARRHKIDCSTLLAAAADAYAAWKAERRGAADDVSRSSSPGPSSSSKSERS